MSNPPYDRRASPLDPEMMSPAERLAEAASLLTRGIPRRPSRPDHHQSAERPPGWSSEAVHDLC